MSIHQTATMTAANTTTSSIPVLFTITDLGTVSYLAAQLGVLGISIIIFMILISGIVAYSIYLLKKGETNSKTTFPTGENQTTNNSSSSYGLFNRNRWVMIGLSLTMLVFRTLGMIFCIISKSFVLNMRQTMESYVKLNFDISSQEYRDVFVYENSTITNQQIGMDRYWRDLDQGFYSLEIFFSTNTVTILLIGMCFIGNIFLKTVIHAKGESQSKGSKVLLYIFNALSIFFGISFFIMVVILSIISPLFWLKILSRDAGNSVFYVMAVLFGSQLITQSIFSIINTIKVIQVIKEMGKTGTSRKALIKVTILQLILLLTAFIFLLAAICYSVYGYYLYLIYIILLNVGVFVFVSVILAISTSSA